MANIQQSFNQMLYTGTVAAGLYAHSPTGQKQAKIRGLEREEKILSKKIEPLREKDFSEKQDIEEAEKLAERKGDIKKEQYELAPSKARFKAMRDAEKSLKEYTAAKENQKEAYKIRKQLLEGTPEVPTKKVKIMEVDSNG